MEPSVCLLARVQNAIMTCKLARNYTMEIHDKTWVLHNLTQYFCFYLSNISLLCEFIYIQPGGQISFSRVDHQRQLASPLVPTKLLCNYSFMSSKLLNYWSTHLKLRYGWEIASHLNIWMQLLIQVMISDVNMSLEKEATAGKRVNLL